MELTEKSSIESFQREIDSLKRISDHLFSYTIHSIFNKIIIDPKFLYQANLILTNEATKSHIDVYSELHYSLLLQRFNSFSIEDQNQIRSNNKDIAEFWFPSTRFEEGFRSWLVKKILSRTEELLEKFNNEQITNFFKKFNELKKFMTALLETDISDQRREGLYQSYLEILKELIRLKQSCSSDLGGYLPFDIDSDSDFNWLTRNFLLYIGLTLEHRKQLHNYIVAINEARLKVLDSVSENTTQEQARYLSNEYSEIVRLFDNQVGLWSKKISLDFKYLKCMLSDWPEFPLNFTCALQRKSAEDKPLKPFELNLNLDLKSSDFSNLEILSQTVLLDFFRELSELTLIYHFRNPRLAQLIMVFFPQGSEHSVYESLVQPLREYPASKGYYLFEDNSLTPLSDVKYTLQPSLSDRDSIVYKRSVKFGLESQEGLDAMLKAVQGEVKSETGGDNTQGRYARYVVPDNPNGIYLAFGITCAEAREQLQQGSKSKECFILLAPLYYKSFLMKDFQDYLLKDKKINIASLKNPSQEGENDRAILSGFIDFYMDPAKVGSVCHPCILRALAHLNKLKLRIWSLGDHQQLIPYQREGVHDYAVYTPPNIENPKCMDLLFTEKNSIEMLKLTGCSGSEDMIYPLQSEKRMIKECPFEFDIFVEITTQNTNSCELWFKDSFAKETGLVSRSSISSKIIESFYGGASFIADAITSIPSTITSLPRKAYSSILSLFWEQPKLPTTEHPSDILSDIINNMSLKQSDKEKISNKLNDCFSQFFSDAERIENIVKDRFPAFLEDFVFRNGLALKVSDYRSAINQGPLSSHGILSELMSDLYKKISSDFPNAISFEDLKKMFELNQYGINPDKIKELWLIMRRTTALLMKARKDFELPILNSTPEFEALKSFNFCPESSPLGSTDNLIELTSAVESESLLRGPGF